MIGTRSSSRPWKTTVRMSCVSCGAHAALFSMRMTLTPLMWISSVPTRIRRSRSCSLTSTLALSFWLLRPPHLHSFVDSFIHSLNQHAIDYIDVNFNWFHDIKRLLNRLDRCNDNRSINLLTNRTSDNDQFIPRFTRRYSSLIEWDQTAELTSTTPIQNLFI